MTHIMVDIETLGTRPGAHVVDAIKAAMAHNDGTYGKVQSLKVGW